jgi:hypothetical protein
LAAIRILNNNSSEKDKMRTTAKNILEQFVGIQNFFELKTISADLVFMSDDYIDIILGKDYYDVKDRDQFSF